MNEVHKVQINVMDFSSQDTLFEALEKAMLASNYLVITNVLHDYGREQVVLYFLEKYKMFIKYTRMSSKNSIWKMYIKLRTAIKFPYVKNKYSVLANAYTKNYYLTNCGGYEDFNASNGTEIALRLKDVYNLINPSEGERILDVGCGRGELTFALAMSGAKAEGVDYSKEAIDLAKQTFDGKAANLKYTCADVFQIEYINLFDKIVMADVVEHIEQEVLEKIFEKIARSLNKNGMFIIHTAPNKDYYDFVYPQERKKALAIGYFKPKNPRSYYEQIMHINEQTPAGLEKALKKYFPYIKVWTGCVGDIDAEKTFEQKCCDGDIFAVACKKRAVLDTNIDWIIKQPELSKCHVVITASDIMVPLGTNEVTLPIKVANLGEEIFFTRKKFPINLAYHILDQEGHTVIFDGERTPIYDAIKPRMSREMNIRLKIPLDLQANQEYIYRITLVAEKLFWFDQEDGNKTDISLRIQ